MADLGELFQKHRKARQDKRAENHQRSVELLESSGIEYQKLSDYHYLVAGTYDYWPSTGLFVNRSTKKRGRGIFKIIAKCREVAND
jgi:hypothetical protein